MSRCAAFTYQAAPPADVVTVVKHKALPGGPTLQYMNVSMQGSDGSISTPAEQYVSRSGGIIDNCSDFYLGITRMSYSLNVPYQVAEPLYVAGDWDRAVGDTTWSIAVQFDDPLNAPMPGMVYISTVAIKVPPRFRTVGVFTSPPLDWTCSFPTLSDWVFAVNEAISTAMASVKAAAALAPVPLDPDTTAFVSVAEPGSALLKLSLYPYGLWAVVPGAADPFVTLQIDDAALASFSGWDISNSLGGGPVGGRTIQAVADGSNYFPPNASGITLTLAPTDPATTTLWVYQNSPSFTVPGVERISVIATLPVNPEYTADPSGGKSSELVLTDFAIQTGDVVGSNRDVYVYDSVGTAGTRWLRMVGGSTVTEFSIRMATVDWLGTKRPFWLRGSSDKVSIKLCFAPVDVVES